MSEHGPVPDGEVFYTFEHRGRKMEATTLNTSIWQHMGDLAVYNCVQVRLTFVWQDNQHYSELLYRAMLNECENHSRLRSVHSVIKTIFDDEHLADLHKQETIPDEWTDEDGPSSPQDE